MGSTSYDRRAGSGQSTAEFALVLAAFVVIVLGLSGLWHTAEGGKFAEHALTSAPNHIAGAAGAWGEVLSY